MSEQQSKCGCKIQGDGFAIVCRKHYSEVLNCDAESYLITSESYARKIWKKLKVKITK